MGALSALLIVSPNLIKMVPNVLQEPQQCLQSQEAPAANPKCPHLCGDPWSESAGCANSAQTKHFLNQQLNGKMLISVKIFSGVLGRGGDRQQWFFYFFISFFFCFWLIFEIALGKKKQLNTIV